MNEAGLNINEIDHVVFYDKPLLKFERLLETYYAYAPKGLFSFIQAMPVWIKEKVFLFRTDKYGFIEPSFRHQNSDLNVFFLGGSTTECSFVHENERFVYLTGV